MVELRPRPISKPGSSDKTPASNEQSQSVLRAQIQAVKKRLAEVDKKYHFYETRTPSGARGTAAMLAFWDELLRQYNYLNRRLSQSSRRIASANKEEERKIKLANDRRLARNRGEGASTVRDSSRTTYRLRSGYFILDDELADSCTNI
ncbi:uncharacterized protein LDX57_011424 [Aspergillus melleus]|uniref:uncharacterized protein n=1 Tax=Aspergillus melleus TaxID=138277 RepID=UPI001E8E7C59|nr:uncharacterized protein LDX57_011424 [Aspergillus melleus]KAH8433790.1 hypothetical protein LDX57_011424 [Aspergillus melleus]